jgi:DNA-binding CsgD family transcriptional regulator
VPASKTDLHVIRQLCLLPGSSKEFFPVVLPLVRKVMDADSVSFFWVDQLGGMVDLVTDSPLPTGASNVYFDRFHEDPIFGFKASFEKRCLAIDPISDTHFHEEDLGSAYYREVMSHLNVRNILYGIVKTAGRGVGQMSLYRQAPERKFRTDEKLLARRIVRYLEYGLSRPTEQFAEGVFAGQEAEGEFDGLFVVDGRNAIVSVSTNAKVLIHRALGVAIRRTLKPEDLNALIEGLREASSDKGKNSLSSVTVPNKRVANENGVFMLRAYKMGLDDELLYVRIQQLKRLQTAFAQSLLDAPLTPKQREIALYLGAGYSNKEIAAFVKVTPNTSAYHIKQIFHRLNVHTREAMVARVVSQK